MLALPLLLYLKREQGARFISWLATLYIWMRFLNFKNKVIDYANEAVLPVFVLHPSVILIIAFYVLPMNLYPGIKFLVMSTTALIATLVLYELLIRRINELRWLFGLKTSKPMK